MTISPPPNVRGSFGTDDATGGATSNTPPQTSHLGDSALLPITGGEDWLEWMWYINWSENRWPQVREKLECAKKCAAIPSKDRADKTGDIIKIGTFDAIVDPGGRRLGDRIKGPYMAYAFQCMGLQFLVADRQQPQKRNPSMLVRATGLMCLMLGGHQCYQFARDMVVMLGGTVEREKLSRVDMATDIPGQAFEPLLQAYKQDRYITRAKSHGMQTSNGSTVKIGEAPLSLRLYDKLAELRKSQDGQKWSLMAYHRWSGIEPDEAARAEFQIGRSVLVSRGIDTVGDYFERRGDLARYLCNDWVRLTSIVPDRTHTTRAPILPLWQRITDGFMAWAGEPSGIPLTPLPREAVDVNALSRGAAGTILTAAAIKGIEFNTVEQLVLFAAKELRHQFNEMGWQERLRRKRVQFALSHSGK